MVLVDLHVHTPASSCYQCKGNLNEEGHYLNILREYKKRNIKLIAITDHNTLKGYKKLMEIKRDLEERINSLDIKNDEHREEILRVTEDLELFKDVNIVPGVEFTAYPHIHILMLFNKNDELSKVDEFLFNHGYDTEDKQGRDLDNTKNLDVLGTLKLGRKLGAITIAAHIDRETGLLTWLQQSNVEDRSIFNSKELMGVHVLKEETVNYLKNKILDRKLTFIKASDFHNEIDDMEKRSTLMELDTLDYEGLLKIFSSNGLEIKLEWN
ncbi:MAG: PHP domain-containing protein [Clostridium sp.]